MHRLIFSPAEICGIGLIAWDSLVLRRWRSSHTSAAHARRHTTTSSPTWRHAASSHTWRHAAHTRRHTAHTRHTRPTHLLHAGLHLLHGLLYRHLERLLCFLHDSFEFRRITELMLVEGDYDVRVLNAALLVVRVNGLDLSHLLYHWHAVLRQLTHLCRDEGASDLLNFS